MTDLSGDIGGNLFAVLHQLINQLALSRGPFAKQLEDSFYNNSVSNLYQQVGKFGYTMPASRHGSGEAGAQGVDKVAAAVALLQRVIQLLEGSSDESDDAPIRSLMEHANGLELVVG